MREGYRFIGRRCDRAGRDGFHTRLMLRDVLCLRGAEAVDLLYESPDFTRRGAMPGWVLRLLQDKGSVQQLEGAEHRARKALFTRLLIESDADATLARIFGAALLERIGRGGRVNVLRDTVAPLSRAACDWCGLGADFAGDRALAAALFEMSDRAGFPGPGSWAALARRRRVEARLAAAVREWRRAGPPEAASPLADFCRATGERGRPLPPETVAVELLNLLRPIVAVGRYVAFAARLLILRPDWRERLRAAEEAEFDRFAEEIRRISPFFPFVGAISERPVHWRGETLDKGQWVIADLHGTCHDARRFPDPDAFLPGRRLDWRHPAPGFVPQGAGDPARTHRCPGEKVTVALIAEATRILTRGPAWTAPEQDLGIDLARIPARPASGVELDFGPARG
ncbi:cytochrome P450 [Amaricoccus solimangrovi]|uniref:Cytochrome P450 n=2 Tax=Amaricoccus solimangrovi TaxID=2589815 RepID=A0A501WUE2_9RHOB|nr:cytochrome P450 [Amaricoccus solimangrovi]